MNRQEVLNQYQVNELFGTIESPGQFEGEMIYVPALWEMVISGFGEPIYEQSDVIYERITVDENLKKEFPEIKAQSFVLWQNDNGFIYCEADND